MIGIRIFALLVLAQNRYPLILHTALTGSVERFMYLMLDSAVKMEESGNAGHLPLWLTPEQVRLLPVSDAYLHKAVEIADQLEKEHIRVGVDDRPKTVGKKVRDSRMDWVAYDSVKRIQWDEGNICAPTH